jgi:hypothetical protein
MAVAIAGRSFWPQPTVERTCASREFGAATGIGGLEQLLKRPESGVGGKFA